jgi:hypothetical protein
MGEREFLAAPAFQPLLAQAKACGYLFPVFDWNS